MKIDPSSKILPAVALLTLITGCVSTGEKAPNYYKPDSSVVSQAEHFIEADNEKHMQGVSKLGVLSCNVMFGMTSAASAATSGGFGSHRSSKSTRRADTKVTVTYTAAGLEEKDLQGLADKACTNAEKQLADAGFQVVPYATIKAHKHHQAILADGRPSPFEYKAEGTRYLVLARSGETVTDSRYIGASKGFAQSFKSVTGDSIEQLEGYLMKDLGMTGVSINLLVDFSSMQSDGKKSFLGLANKDSAEVKAEVRLAVSGDLRFQPIGKQKCWSEYGKEKCMIKNNHQPVFATKQAVSTPAVFYSGIDDVTSTGEKVTSGVTKVVGTLLAFGGTNNKVSRDITRYQVNVITDVYLAETVALSNGLLGMAAAKAAASR